MPIAGGRAVAAVLTAALLVTACTGDDGGGKQTDGTTSQSAGAGGTMRVGLPGDLVVDPAATSLASPAEQMVLDLLYDGLTKLDADGAPQLAVAAKLEHNKTFDAWRFTLPADATFSDGSPLTPADAIASFEHVAEGGDGSLPALALEPIVGFRAFVDGKADHISGLTAPDAHTVRIATTGPLAVLPALLASPELGIVKVDALDGVDGPDDLGDLPLSGAWKVTDTGDDEVSLAPRGDVAGVEEVTVHTYDDDVDAYNAFEDGDIDWAVVPQAEYGDAVDASGTDAFAPFQAELFFGMNLASPNLGNGFLRIAIATAIDRDEIVKAVYSDLADPLGTVIPAGVPGHDDSRCSPCEPDLTQAKALVKAGYPDGKVPTITVDYDESPAQTAMAKIIAEDLKAAGIPTKLHPMSLEDYKRFVVSGSQELFTFGWIGAFTSPDAYLSRLFQSSSNDNLTNYRSTTVDGLLQRARATDDAPRQQLRWAAAETEVLNAAAVVPIAQFRTQVVVSKRVSGWHHRVDGSVDWSAVTVGD